MAVTADFARYVLEQLTDLGRLHSRRMFGALGLYSDDAFFGLISRDVLYFKVGDANRSDYDALGMAQFRPFEDRPLLSMNYYEVPADILEDAEECVAWAARSVGIARAARAAPKPRRAKASPKARSAAKGAPKKPRKKPRRRVR